MPFSTRKITMRSRARRFFQNLFIIFTATTAVLLPATIAVRAAENDELHEIETKYIFGTFTVGSSTGIEGEKAFEPETFNLLYEPETTRGDLGIWSKESTFGISSALAYQVVPNVVIGADLWYLRHYDGATFNSFTGDAVYLGPTFYWKIAPKVLMSAAWQAQIAGHEAGISSTLDLTDFSRSRARLLLEFEF